MAAGWIQGSLRKNKNQNVLAAVNEAEGCDCTWLQQKTADL